MTFGIKIFFYLVGLLCWIPSFCAPLKINVKAPYAALVDVETGNVLYSKRGEVKTPPASTTKIATLLYAMELIEESELDELVTVPPECLVYMDKKVKIQNDYKIAPHWLEKEGISFDLLPGEKIPLKALMLGAFNRSANDAANVIAYHIGGSISAFMDGLNAYLQQIGCNDTHYDNPSGLHFPTHLSTALDLAHMTRHAYRYPKLFEIAQTLEYERPKTNKRPAMMIESYNKLLKEGKFYYPHATGFKTGYIENAGYCLVATAENTDRKLIAVVLKEENKSQRYRDVITMFNAAFQEEKVSRLLYNKDETVLFREVEKGTSRLKATLKEDVIISFYPSMEPEIETETIFRELIAPIARGAQVGEIVVREKGGGILKQVPLHSIDGVGEKFLFKIAKSWSIWKGIVVVIVIAAILAWRYKQCQIRQFLRRVRQGPLSVLVDFLIKKWTTLKSQMR